MSFTATTIQATSASPAAVKQRASSVVKEKYPDYKIIVLNDDFNTFEHVVKTLTTYIPGVNSDQAWDLADKIHNDGQAIVWVGPLEQAELYHSQLIRAGLTMAPLEKA
ncbi:ATP-dependent Clp protease adapter ClpS [Leptolyngbya sp. BC1307]|uniref:ATP-dependent Clp protease adapter ClpS n=1 Tax=Leptolyngbya sp. BC1307 TaxID=2029589 RepID=UPI000EFD8D6A|nr:ATP-dependent Clp protease adapter ClpS [Leptolyngbya sp. BC1307]